MRRSPGGRPLPRRGGRTDAADATAPHDPPAVRAWLDALVGAPGTTSTRTARAGVLPPRLWIVAVAVAVAAVVAVAVAVAVAVVVWPPSSGATDSVAVSDSALQDGAGQDGAAPEQPAAVEGAPDDEPAPADEPAAEDAPTDDAPDDAPADQPAAAGVPTGEPVTLVFGGDVHVLGDAGDAVRAGLPTVRDVLSSADVAMLNLETAVTERGTAAPGKQYVYRTPASSLTRLREAGVDVVTGANNHGLDYGQEGLRDTLAAEQATGMPIVGLGDDEDEAYAPHVVTVRGQRIAFLGASQVLDSSLQEAWTAMPGKPGMASAKRADRLVAEVERAREQADTVVVYLHWGRELEPCPLPRQQELARQLVDAGADVLVGGHAHVLLGGGYLDDAYVDYGLGNFVFNSHRAESRRSGVLTLTVQGRAVTAAEWIPADIRGGTPHVLSGAQAQAAVADKEARRACTGLSATPASP